MTCQGVPWPFGVNLKPEQVSMFQLFWDKTLGNKCHSDFVRSAYKASWRVSLLFILLVSYALITSYYHFFAGTLWIFVVYHLSYFMLARTVCNLVIDSLNSRSKASSLVSRSTRGLCRYALGTDAWCLYFSPDNWGLRQPAHYCMIRLQISIRSAYVDQYYRPIELLFRKNHCTSLCSALSVLSA